MNFIIKILFCISLTWGVAFSAQANASGSFRLVKGEVLVQKKSSPNPVKAKLGMQVSTGDIIITSADSRAKLVMIDNNVINISPDSYLEIQRYEYNKNHFEKNVELKVLFGKVRAFVNQKYDEKENRFIIKTPSALAGVRGTDFLTSYDNKTNTTKIVTFKGSVSFANFDLNGKIQAPVYINMGQYSENKIYQLPSAPKALPTEEFKQLNASTDIQLPSPPKTDEEKFLDHELKDGNGSTKDREPANSGGVSPMVDMAEDLGMCNNCQPQPIGPQLQLPGPPPTRVQTPDTEACQFCDRVIEDGNTKVNINLIPKSQ